MLWYVYYCLSGAAAEQILSWMKIYAKLDESITKKQIDVFFDHLNFTFLDKSLQKKALQRLNIIHQEKQSFQKLLAEFQHLLMKADDHAWDDAVKIGFLNETMNWEMKNRMMSVKTDKGFKSYCCQLQEIVNKLDEIQWLVNTWNTVSVKHSMLASYSNSAANPQSQSHLIWWTESHQHKRTGIWSRDRQSGLMIRNINSRGPKKSVSVVIQQCIRFVSASFYQHVDPRSTLNFISSRQKLPIFLMLCWKKKMSMRLSCWEKSGFCAKSHTEASYPVDEEEHLKTRLARV